MNNPLCKTQYYHLQSKKTKKNFKKTSMCQDKKTSHYSTFTSLSTWDWSNKKINTHLV